MVYLDSSSSNDGQMQKLLDEARNAFRAVKVFLMPKPGEAPTDDTTVTAVKDLDATFLKQLQSLVESVVDELISPRTFEDVVLQSRDLLDVMLDIDEGYSNEEEVTSDVVKILKEKKEERLFLIVKVAERFYKGKLQKRWKRFSRDTSRQMLHAELKNLTLEKFDTDCKEEFIPARDATTSRGELEVTMDEMFQQSINSHKSCVLM
ncbi:uncharacterized protein LOC144747596 [Ciona intestinalis]